MCVVYRQFNFMKSQLMQAILCIGKLLSQRIYIFSSSQISHDELVLQTVYSKNRQLNEPTDHLSQHDGLLKRIPKPPESIYKLA